jgi:hypothetical protein
VFHAERRIPLHDGILERTVDEVEHARIAERDFWVRAAKHAAEREERVRNRAHKRDGTRLGKQRQARH